MTPEEARKELARQGGLGPGAVQTGPDPNRQAGVDQYGNPINHYGLPLGQSPPPPPGPNDGYTPPDQRSPGAQWASGAWDDFSGENSYNPLNNAWFIDAPVMQAEQMQNAGMNTQQADADRQLGLGARADQQRVGNAIMQRALGQGGPSVAELQMQRGVGLAQQAAARQAASARGIGRGLANYGAMNAQANLAAQGVQDAAALRAQEQIAAQGLASKNAADMRMQDLTSRGMSIQQAQAIMDAENQTRQFNTTAVNQARTNNQNAALTAGQANLQRDTNLRQMTTQITEGEAARGQSFLGKVFSDVRAKQDVQPLLYSNALQVYPQQQQQGPDVNEQARQLEQDRKFAEALKQRGPVIQPAVEQPKPMLLENPYDTPPPTQDEGGGLVGDVLDFVGISDKRAKEDAFKAGLQTGAGLVKAKIASEPVFDVGPERINKMAVADHKQAVAEYNDAHARAKARDKWKNLGKSAQSLRDNAALLLDPKRPAVPPARYQDGPPIPPRPAAEPEPVPNSGVPMLRKAQLGRPPPLAMQDPGPASPTSWFSWSDKNSKYDYSDKKAKDLEAENSLLRAALGRMGDEAARSVSGAEPAKPASPKLAAALGRMGNEADVSNLPPTEYPKPADVSRNANPPPPYQYRYKDEFAKKQGTDTNPRLGIMAQDALKSPVYKPAVVKMPDGMLGIDSNRLLHANTAMIGAQNDRMDEVEAQNEALAAALTQMGNQRAAEIRGGPEDAALMRGLTEMGNRRANAIRSMR